MVVCANRDKNPIFFFKGHDTRDPLFLTVSYMNPHSPLQPLDEDLAKVPSNATNTVGSRVVMVTPSMLWVAMAAASSKSITSA